MPFFSVVTVVRNDVVGLRSTQHSLIEQACDDFEWVVVDGGSSDGTKQAVMNAGGLVTAWLSEPDEGIYDAMNKGVWLTRGRYIIFMNAGDCFARPDVLMRVREGVLSGTEYPDVIAGGAWLLFRSGQRVYRPPRCAARYIWHGLPAVHQATYYTRESLLRFPFDTTYRIAGDYYLAAKLYAGMKTFLYMDQPLVEFVVGGTSYQKPLTLIAEHYTVQKEILHVPILWRAVSLARMVGARTAFGVLSVLR